MQHVEFTFQVAWSGAANVSFSDLRGESINQGHDVYVYNVSYEYPEGEVCHFIFSRPIAGEERHVLFSCHRLLDGALVCESVRLWLKQHGVQAGDIMVKTSHTDHWQVLAVMLAQQLGEAERIMGEAIRRLKRRRGKEPDQRAVEARLLLQSFRQSIGVDEPQRIA